MSNVQISRNRIGVQSLEEFSLATHKDKTSQKSLEKETVPEIILMTSKGAFTLALTYLYSPFPLTSTLQSMTFYTLNPLSQRITQSIGTYLRRKKIFVYPETLAVAKPVLTTAMTAFALWLTNMRSSTTYSGIFQESIQAGLTPIISKKLFELMSKIPVLNKLGLIVFKKLKKVIQSPSAKKIHVNLQKKWDKINIGGIDPVTLDDTTLQQFISKGFSIVYFTADWYSSNWKSNPMLTELANKFKEKIQVGQVNTSTSKKSSGTHDISSLPTIILFKNGHEVKRFVGKDELEKIVSDPEELFKQKTPVLDVLGNRFRSLFSNVVDFSKHKEKEQKIEPVILDDTIIKQFISEGFSLVHFTADWYSKNWKSNSVLKELANKFKGNIQVGQINISAAKESSDTYLIDFLPTIILFKDGNEVKRFVGANEKDEDQIFNWLITSTEKKCISPNVPFDLDNESTNKFQCPLISMCSF